MELLELLDEMIGWAEARKERGNCPASKEELITNLAKAAIRIMNGTPVLLLKEVRNGNEKID